MITILFVIAVVQIFPVELERCDIDMSHAKTGSQINYLTDNLLMRLNAKLDTDGKDWTDMPDFSGKMDSKKSSVYRLSKGSVYGIASLMRVGDAISTLNKSEPSYIIHARSTRIHFKYYSTLDPNFSQKDLIYGDPREHTLTIRLDPDKKNECQYVLVCAQLDSLGQVGLSTVRGINRSLMINSIKAVINQKKSILKSIINKKMREFIGSRIYTEGACSSHIKKYN